MKYKFDKRQYVKKMLLKYLGMGLIISYVCIIVITFNRVLLFNETLLLVFFWELLMLLILANRIRTKGDSYVNVSELSIVYSDIIEDGYILDTNFGRRRLAYWYHVSSIEKIVFSKNGIRIYGQIYWEREKMIDSKIKNKKGEKRELFIPAYYEKWDELVLVLSNYKGER